eukprot:7350535-Prymnesium_polylepis.1
MNVSERRSSGSPTVAMSTPSMAIVPPLSSARRSSATETDDFPAPVRPTIAALRPPAMSKSMPRSTSGSSGR